MKTTLIVMAAGIGSRFGGGIKQLTPVGPNGELIIDYSVFDALEAGFDKIVFIIRKDIEKDFREIIGDRLQEKLDCEIAYAFQDIQDIPEGFTVPEGRTKPWGTGHAVLSCKDIVKEPCAVINADDYYGKEAFKQVHDWLVLEHDKNAISMAGFILKNTLSDNGGVTRGVCKMAEGHTHMVDVVETKNIVKTAEGAEADGVKLDPESYVSMNFWGFPAKEGEKPEYIKRLEEDFATFFKEDVANNPETAEYLLPTHIGGLLRENKVTVKVLETNDKWFGVTYAEDKDAVIDSFKQLIADGVYKSPLM